MTRQKALEFYSGIGGMHYGLKECLAWMKQQGQGESMGQTIIDDVEVVAAFEIHDIANAVYNHNHRGAKNIARGTNLASIKPAYLKDTFGMVHLWLMSPPCQPYTRQKSSKQLGAEDRRASSFHHLMHTVLPSLCDDHVAPRMIFIENVRGFIGSVTHTECLARLAALGYAVEQYLLSPHQLGIPHTRRRYYLLAHRRSPAGRPPRPADSDEGKAHEAAARAAMTIHETLPAHMGPMARVPDALGAQLAPYLVPATRVSPQAYLPASRWTAYGHLMDKVTASSTHSRCFTKNYTVYVEGAGSILLDDRSDATPTAETDTGHPADTRTAYRFFEPEEVARLMGFPWDHGFQFPDHVTRRQQYKLLGNSVHVRVVALMLYRLLSQ